MGPMMKLHQNTKPSDELEEKMVFFSVKTQNKGQVTSSTETALQQHLQGEFQAFGVLALM